MGDEQNDAFFGRMNAPMAAASVRGMCGDEMEFYLDIRDDRIEEVLYQPEAAGKAGL